MRMMTFAKRCTKEILRDPINVSFGLGFPLVLLVLLSAMQANIPVSMFEINTLTPGITVFSLSFMTLFSATLIAKDRESALLQRLYTTPLTGFDFIIGYMLPILPISLGQTICCYLFAIPLGLTFRVNIIYAVIGNIPMAIFKARTQCIGKPDVSQLVYDEYTIDEFTSVLNLQEARTWDAKLVRIKDVHYTGYYFTTSGTAKCTTGNPEDDTNANVFAPTTENIGYPQSRVIEDENGNKTAISSSEYAKFAHFYIPGADKNGVNNCSKYVGDVVGILGFYSDNARYAPAYDDWSITIRSLDDLQLRDDEGNLWPRVEYTK